MAVKISALKISEARRLFSMQTEIEKIVELVLTNDNENIALAGSLCVGLDCRRRAWVVVIKEAKEKAQSCLLAKEIIENQMYKYEMFIQSFYQTANASGLKPWELRG